MPCRLRIKIYEARGLPVNHSNANNNNIDSLGSFVEIKLSDLPPCRTTYKKSLNPIWKEDFRFEISKDKIIQDDPVELRVRWGEMGDEIVGVVYIDINSLLMNSGPAFINGWFPIYDTFRGIRGLLHALIKLEFVDNINQFRDSSAGIKFFSVDEAMANQNIIKVIGLVSDVLIVNDLPESKYSQRASNEQRLRMLYQISGKLRRKIGIKVQKMGGNSVLGYHQHFDFEGGDNPLIIAKGYGSASVVKKLIRMEAIQPQDPLSSGSLGITPPNVYSNIYQLSSTIANELFQKGTGETCVHISTLKTIPSSFSIQFGSIVTARSVKTLHGTDRITRNKWWETLREEIKSHARLLNCDLILGYTESFTSFDDVGILTVMGTACKLNNCNNNNNNNNELNEGRQRQVPESPTLAPHSNNLNSSTESFGYSSSIHSSFEALGPLIPDNNNNNNNNNNNINTSSNNLGISEKKAKREKKLKKKKKKKTKKSERKGRLPEIILSTTDLPPRVKLAKSDSQKLDPNSNANIGSKQPDDLPPLFQARVCKVIRRQEGEQLINEICAMIPQIEFELNTQLIYYLRKRNLNSCFSLTYQLAFRSNILIYIATGSAFLLSNKSFSNISLEDVGIYSDAPDGKIEYMETIENAKNSYYLEVNSDRNYLLENFVPLLTHFVFPKHMIPYTTQSLPNDAQNKKCKTHMATILTRMQWTPSKQPNTEISDMFQYLYSKLVFQFFECTPCKISELKVDLLLDETDIQLLLTAVVSHDYRITDEPLSLINPSGYSTSVIPSNSPPEKSLDSFFIPNSPARDSSYKLNNQSVDSLSSQLNNHHHINNQINNTAEIILSYSSSIPGFYIKKYVGRIDHHFIRENKVDESGAQTEEDTCIRESFAIIKAHLASLGANAIIGFKINTILFKRSREKLPSQTPDRLTSTYRVYGLVSLSGDAVIARPHRKIPLPDEINH